MSKKAEEYVIERRATEKAKSDPLEEAIEEEDRELAREAKRKRLEAIVLERKIQTKKLTEQLEEEESAKEEAKPEAPMTTGALVTNLIQGGVDPKVLNEWLKSLDPQALGALIALQSNNPTLAMLAFGMSSQKKGEGLTVKDVLELNKATAGTQPSVTIDVARLVEVASGAGKPSEVVSPKEMVDSTIAAIQTGMEIAGAGRGGEKEQSWFDKLMSTPDGIKTAQEVGLFGGNPEYLRLQKEIRDADRNFMREMKESERRWQMHLQKMREDSKRLWEEAKERRRRTDLAAGALRRIGRAVARGIAETEEEEEEEAEEAKPAPKKKEGKVKTYECSECGEAISVPPNVKEGDTVQCAKCGSTYEVTK